MTINHTERRSHEDSDAYFNAQFDANPVSVKPGEIYWSDQSDQMMVSHVGAGLAVSIFDQELKMGTLAYVLLPQALEQAFPYFKELDQSILDKALEPLERAITEMKAHGAGKNRILIRLTGAAQLPCDTEDLGVKHSVFIKEYLSRKGLGVLNEDLGGPYIRRLHFFPDSGRMVRISLKRESDFEHLAALEKAFQENITSHL